MITIGIEGKPASGKTTLSKYLTQTYPYVERIEVDKIVEEMGLDGLRDAILTCVNIFAKMVVSGKGRYKRKIKSEDDKIQKKIRTPIVFKIAANAYFKSVSDSIKRQLEICEKRGDKIVVVDYALLNISSIWKEFDYRVLVNRNEEDRREAMKKRDGKDDKDVDFFSIFSNFDVVKYG